MATKDISDAQVCRAFAEYKLTGAWPYETLENMTGQPFKVCLRAMERAVERGLVDYGVSLRTGWLTDAGKKLIEESGGQNA